MTRTLLVLSALTLASSALAAERTLNVPVTATAGQPVPVSMTLLRVRDTLGADFAVNWNSLRVLAGTREVPYQIDDLDGNGRVSGPDELAFLASGPVTLKVSDTEAAAPTYPASMTVTKTGDNQTIAAGTLKVEVTPKGLTRILNAQGGVMADEIGNLRVEGFNNSTFWKDKALGAYLEGKTTLSGMDVKSVAVLKPGPVRTVVVSRLSSPDFVGLEQTLVSRVYGNGMVDVTSTVVSRGYADMMKLEHQATRLMSELDPDALHITPLFRRVGYAEFTKQTPDVYFGDKDRNALLKVGGKNYVSYKLSGNLRPAFWGAPYLFVSPEAWRTNYSTTAKMGVAELAYGTPALAKDWTTFVQGDQWQFESGEFRTGLFKWLPDELKKTEAGAALATQPDPWVSHLYPGDTFTWHYLYEPYTAADANAAVGYLEKRAADLASISLSKP